MTPTTTQTPEAVQQLSPYSITIRVGRKTYTWIRFGTSQESAELDAAEAVQREYHGRGRVVSVEITDDPRRPQPART